LLAGGQAIMLVAIYVKIEGLEPPKHINQLFRGKVVIIRACAKPGMSSWGSTKTSPS
jgi:hypothetical protein